MNQTITYRKPVTTMLEVFESLPEGTLAQLIKNQLFMSPAPSDTHQRVVLEIANKIYNWLKKSKTGLLRTAPYDVYLDSRNVYQPDIVFISNEKATLIKENGFHGVPDLIIEVLSIHNAHHDLGEKMEVYARKGVKEYWLIEPYEKLARGYWLVNDEFHQFAEKNGVVNSKLLQKKFSF